MRVAALLGALLLAGCLQEAAPADAPRAVVIERGLDASGPYVPGFDVAPAGDAFTAALRGVAGATVHADELMRLRSTDGSPHAVRLSADTVGSPLVREARLTFRGPDGQALARLDLRDAHPAADFMVPAEGAVRVEWTLALAPEAEAFDLARAVRMDVAG